MSHCPVRGTVRFGADSVQLNAVSTVRRVGPLTEQDVKLRAGRGWGNRAPTEQEKLFIQAAGLLTTTNSGSTSFFGTQHRSTLLSLHFDVRRWSKNHP